MKPLIVLGMLAALTVPTLGVGETPPLGGTASDQAAVAQASGAGVASDEVAKTEGTAAMGVGPHQAASVDLEAQLYHSRPLVIFADSPENPDFLRQLQLIERDLAALEERRVVVVLDSDPAAQSEWRRRLRPNGFSLVLLDTDLRPVIRKPSPWDMREIGRTIDRLPSRRQDLSQQFPAGR